MSQNALNSLPPPPPSGKAGWRWKLAQALEKRWWRRYLHNRDPEAYRDWKAAYWNKLIDPHREALELDRKQRILDAGCGPAGINMVLTGHEVVALDPLLATYEKTLPGFPVWKQPGVQYLTGTLEDHRPAHPYDGLCCLNAINHVDELGLALDALTAAAKPGGWLLLGVDVHRHNAGKKLFRLLPGDALHPHQHDSADYRTLLGLRGWEIQDERILKPGRIFDYVLFRACRSG